MMMLIKDKGGEMYEKLDLQKEGLVQTMMESGFEREAVLYCLISSNWESTENAFEFMYEEDSNSKLVHPFIKDSLNACFICNQYEDHHNLA